eukprot:5179989-Karenia_brevis.AAC.1
MSVAGVALTNKTPTTSCRYKHACLPRATLDYLASLSIAGGRANLGALDEEGGNIHSSTINLGNSLGPHTCVWGVSIGSCPPIFE